MVVGVVVVVVVVDVVVVVVVYVVVVFNVVFRLVTPEHLVGPNKSSVASNGDSALRCIHVGK